jgi:hypothetical protein
VVVPQDLRGVVTCSACGRSDDSLTVLVTDHDDGSVAEHFLLNGQAVDESVIRTDFFGRRTDAEASRSRGLVDDIWGPPIADKGVRELRAATIFVAHLNANGDDWGPPTSSDELRRRTGAAEDGVDCFSDGADGRRLLMQVTTPEKHFQRLLKERGEAHRTEATPSQAVEAMLAAINNKSTIGGRAQIVLVLDAVDHVRYALGPVVEAFRVQYSRTAQAAGYAAVWVVGPDSEIVHRLDAC